MAEAARRLGLSRIGYCRYEYGQRKPSAQMLQAIAICFETSVPFLLGETDQTEPDHIVVSKKEKPELFELVSNCYSEDRVIIKRLLAYYYKITASQQ